MKLCLSHWDQLREAIKDRGLDKFVSNSGQQAAEKMQAQLQPGTSELEGWDPLLNANFAIWSNGLERGGLYLMGTDEQGNEYCPLCELEANTSTKAETWIKYAADEQYEKAKKLGVIQEGRA